jgi:hypothetical protein
MRPVKLAFAPLLFLATAHAGAQALFNTLGPGDSYIQNVGRAISGADNSVTHLHGEWGWQFAPIQSGLVGEIKVGVHWLTGVNQAEVKLMTNGAGGTLGTTLGSWTFGGMAPFNTNAPVIRIDTHLAGVTLNAGQQYWILMRPTSLDTYAAWNDAGTGMNGRMAVSADGVTYQYVNNMPYSAFAISTVPEPATLVALGLGVAALLRRRRIIKV